jgi:hypothetical protein
MKMSNKIRKLIFWWTLLIFSIFITLEIINISTDIYNFRQLTKVNNILKSQRIEKFDWLKAFNSKYSQNIKPLPFGKCFYVNSFNWTEKYIFWFRIESNIFEYFLKQKYYFYPAYNVPVFQVCDDGWCEDINYRDIINIISSPCKD